MKYVPAVLLGQINSKRYYKDYDNLWWTDKSFFKYNRLLCSAYHNIKIKDFKTKYHINDDIKVFGDSGGFQLFSSKGQIKIDAKEIVHWQIKNCDYGMTLDYPTADYTSGDRGSGKGLRTKECSTSEFYKRLDYTINNNKIYAQEIEKHKSNLKIYNIIQTSSNDATKTKYWFDKIKDFPFYGYAIGAKPSTDVLLHAKNMAFLLDNNVTKNVHVLGASGFQTMIFLTYASNFIKNLTCDTTSYGNGGRFLLFCLPTTGTKTRIRLHDFNIKSIPCNCPVCSNITLKEYLNKDAVSGNLLNLHNLYEYLSFIKILNSIKQDRELLLKMGKNHPTLIKAFDYLDYSIKNGFTKTLNKYNNTLMDY
jgi:tRNA-guanine family transglycosylase